MPLGVLCCVTGVSGSGKSTLVNEVLYRAVANRLHRARLRPGAHDRIEGLDQVDKIISIDQSPIGRTPRSNPATYTGVFDHIRDLFSRTKEARVRGYKPGRFSFNVKGGRCEVCRGDGQIKIEMHFLPDVYVPCEQCHGRRYNRETLEVRFKGKSIADVLEMSVEEAVEFFAHIPKIKRRLQTLHDVGLDYIRLGQPATTLSGGEAQRIKLATELSKVATGDTLYILDEPTTGLHFADVQRLLEVLGRLVEAGNTVVVIEHNLDVIKSADRIIDLGPEGGEAGGEVVATGTPEQVAASPASYTGQFLRDLVEPAELPARRRSAQATPRAGRGVGAAYKPRAHARALRRPLTNRMGGRGEEPCRPQASAPPARTTRSSLRSWLGCWRWPRRRSPPGQARPRAPGRSRSPSATSRSTARVAPGPSSTTASSSTRSGRPARAACWCSCRASSAAPGTSGWSPATSSRGCPTFRFGPLTAAPTRWRTPRCSPGATPTRPSTTT